LLLNMHHAPTPPPPPPQVLGSRATLVGCGNGNGGTP
jgi:hypothetical protein